MKTIVIAAIIGAIIGAGMIALGFNFHVSRTMWVGGSAAYLPAALAGAAIAAFVVYAWQRQWRA